MASPRDVNNLLHDLHDKKILNLDTSLRAILQPQGLDQLDPGSKVGSAVVAWDGYAVVIANKIASIAEVAALGQGIRQQLGSHVQKPSE